MHKRLIAFALALMILSATGCNKFKARIQFKQGNSYYAEEEYKEALADFQTGLELDPSATFAWRSVGLSALALFRPGDDSEANKQYGELAIEAFEKYLAIPENADDDKVRDYLLSTYVNTKQYDRALAYLEQTKAGATDPKIDKYKINVLTKAERYDEVAKLAMDYPGPDRPEVLYSLGVAAWDESYNDPKWPLDQREHIVDLGLAATERALNERPDYFEAMAYYNLLFREKAKMATDPLERQKFVDQANEWMKKAIELRKKAGAAKPPAGEGAPAEEAAPTTAAPTQG